jgi:hypothetical protein
LNKPQVFIQPLWSELNVGHDQGIIRCFDACKQYNTAARGFMIFEVPKNICPITEHDLLTNLLIKRFLLRQIDMNIISSSSNGNAVTIRKLRRFI